mgnify:CR=1 FL=1
MDKHYIYIIILIIILIVICSCKINSSEKFKSKSQFKQDEWVIKHFNGKRDGVYLEIGTNNGEIDNNTTVLEKEYNWKGVCIDPLMYNVKNRSCKKFRVALGSKPGITKYMTSVDNKHGLSGISEFVKSKYNNKVWADRLNEEGVTKEIDVEVRTPIDVLEESKIPNVIDYMSLDVEGAEMNILKSFPFDKYCIRYSTIETNDDKNKETELRNFMKSKGYKFVKHEGVDDVFSNDCKGF